MLTDLDRGAIAAAVAKAEEGTTGEIVCALAGEVSSYRETPLAWAAAAALVLPPAALLLGVHTLAPLLGGFAWTADQASALEGEVALALTTYAAVQAVLFAIVFLIASIPQVRRWITPRVLKRHKVARAARHQFAALAARAHGSETGVLIFVAPVDRQVQILADAAIHQKCGEGPWREAAQAIAQAMRRGADPTSGIVKAVEICGAALRAHFPGAAPGRAGSSEPIEV